MPSLYSQGKDKGRALGLNKGIFNIHLLASRHYKYSCLSLA